MAVGAVGRRPGRDGADALPGPGHGLRVEPGRLRHGLLVLRHRAGRLHPPPDRGRDRRAGGGGPAGSRSPGRLSNVVFMGMGEPLANYERVWAAIVRLHDRRRPVGPPPDGLHRRGGAGHPPAGPTRRCRSTWPCRCTRPTTACATSWSRSTGATRWPCSMEACRQYLAAKGRRLSFEWALIDGVNDRPSDAVELAGLARPLGAHVNLIPLNPTPGYPVRGTAPAGVRAFRDQLVGPRRQRHGAPQPGHRDRRRLRTAGGRRPGSPEPRSAGPRRQPRLPLAPSRCQTDVHAVQPLGRPHPTTDADDGDDADVHQRRPGRSLRYRLRRARFWPCSCSVRWRPAGGSPTRRSGATGWVCRSPWSRWLYLLLHFSYGSVITLLFYVALVALLLHPESRSYRRTWFR